MASPPWHPCFAWVVPSVLLLLHARCAQSYRQGIIDDDEEIESLDLADFDKEAARTAHIEAAEKLYATRQNQTAGLDLELVAAHLVTRQCMADVAAQWPFLKEDWGHAFPGKVPQAKDAKNESESIVYKIDFIWELKDLIENRQSHYNFIKKKFAKHFSTRIRDWSKQLKKVIKSLREDTGLKYSRLERHCSKGGGDEIKACMKDSTTWWHGGATVWSARLNEALWEDLEKRMCIENFKDLAFPNLFEWRLKWKYPGIKEEILLPLAALKKTIKQKDFPYDKQIRRCRAETKEKIKAKIQVLKKDLSEPVDSRLFKQCVEKNTSFCGEGLSAVWKFKFNTIASAATATFMYPASTGLYCIIGAVPAVAAGISLGPAGVATGLLVGCAVGMAMPGNSAIAVGSGVLMGLATSSLKCACFPRYCSYDNESDQCYMGGPLNKPGKNPYARALPGQGLKCVPYVSKRKKNKSCRYESCTAKDYSAHRSSGLDLSRAGLYGQLGRTDDGKGLANCLSKGSSSSTMMLDAEFSAVDKPEASIENTPEARAALFKDLGLEMKPDDQTTHGKKSPQSPKAKRPRRSVIVSVIRNTDESDQESR